MAEAMIPLGALIAAIDAMEAYVPYAQRENARAAALGHSIGFAYPKKPERSAEAQKSPRVNSKQPVEKPRYTVG